MKLLDVTCANAISEPGGSTSTAFFRTQAGFEIELRDGFVHVRRGGNTRMIPMANVLYMTPDAPAPAQPTKTR